MKRKYVPILVAMMTAVFINEVNYSKKIYRTFAGISAASMLNSNSRLHNKDGHAAEGPYLSNETIARLRKQRNVTPQYELCDVCRVRPRLTCLQRVQDFVGRHKMSEEGAREAVMKENASCNMTRYPVDFMKLVTTSDAEETDGHESLFLKLSYPEADGRNDTGDKTAAARAGDLSIYLYDSLPADMSIGLERIMAYKYGSGNVTYENFRTDIAILHRFRNYRGRTYNPRDADLFVVPFPHASHCLHHSGVTGVWKNACGQVPDDLIRKGVLGNLLHYKGKEERHLFLNVMETFHTHKLMVDVPLSLTIGPRTLPRRRQIVVPYVNDQAAFQPSAVRRRPPSWWTRPRPYSLCYFFSAVNPRMKNGPKKYRVYFLEEVRRSWNATPDIGGLPYVIDDLKSLAADDFLHGVRSFFPRMYARSIFCPVFPGDSPSMKRFFDVIAMGCIPVVLAFAGNADGGGGETATETTTSWYLPGSYSVADSYPWAKGSNSTFPHLEIDYRSFVVEVPASPGDDAARMVRPVLEGLMRNASEIRRRQRTLRGVATLFGYGMGDVNGDWDGDGGGSSSSPSEGGRMDAFTMILESLRFYLSSL